MSGSTKLFNVPANTLRPGPRLVIVRQPTGLTTATMDFTCRKFDIGKPVMQAKLIQGTPLLTLYPDAGTDFDYLYLLDWTSQDEPGGITTVSCNFSGVDVSTTDFTFESSIIYTRNNALREVSIFNHPQYLADTDSGTREILRLGSLGLASKTTASTGSSYEIEKTATTEPLGTLTDEWHRFWWDWIVEKSNTTYDVPTSEWTKSATGRGKLPSSSFTKFGKIDDPPGNPSAPAGDVWRYTGATESISVTGDGANSYSQTWTSGDWPERVFGTVAP